MNLMTTRKPVRASRFARLALCIAGFAATANAATVDSVIVRQMWPWSTDIRVEYKLSGVTAPVDVSVAAFAGSTPLDSSNLASAITGERYAISSGGVHSFTIDPAAAFGSSTVSIPDFKVRLSVADTTSDMTNVLYKIFDLESNVVTDVTKAALLNGEYGAVETDYSRIGAGYSTPLPEVLIWTGVTNYPGAKTTKLVMRKVTAGDFKFRKKMNWDNGSVHNMSVSKDFWIGVFECTQKQFSYFTPTHSGDNYCNPAFVGDAQPMENIAILVTLFNLGTSDDRLATAPNGTLANLRAKFGDGYAYTLPTQAQWYRAMTAGTGSYYYDGLTKPENVSSNDQVAALACYSGNRLESEGTCDVGLYRPNAFGLYDMLGNVREATIDAGNYWNSPSTLVDMANSVSGTWFGAFGGSFKYHGGIWALESDSSAYNVQLHSTYKSNDIGFRLCFAEP